MKTYDKIKKILKKCDVKVYTLFDVNMFNKSRCDKSAQNLTYSQSPIIYEKISQNLKNSKKV